MLLQTIALGFATFVTQIAIVVMSLVCNIVTGIVLGGQPIFGYNYGARKLDRVLETYRLVLIFSLLVGLAATLIFQFCPEIVINLFGSGNELYQELPAVLEQQNAGNGINGILYAAPIADAVAILVILVLTVSFFRNLRKEEIHMA